MNSWFIEASLRKLKPQKNGVLRGKNAVINEIHRQHLKDVDAVDYHNIWNVSIVFQEGTNYALRVAHVKARSKEEAFGVAFLKACEQDNKLNNYTVFLKVVSKINSVLEPTL
jgi:hypothetical protein